MASLQVKIDGQWLTSICRWGDLEYALGWPGDCLDASFQLTTKYGAHDPLLRRDAAIEINRNGWPLWAGKLQEPEWNGKEARISCRGLYRLGENYSDLNSSGDTVDNPAVAIDAQIARGLPWIRGASIPNANMLSGAPQGGNSLAALLDEYAAQDGVYWGVDARRRVYMAPPATEVTYHVQPGAADLSIADDNFASHVLLRIYNGTGYETVAYPPLANAATAYERRWGHNDWRRDMTDVGSISHAAAAGIAQAIYERAKLRPGWTAGLNLMPGELLDRSGNPADFDSVKGNQVVRVHGVRDEIAHTPYVSFVTGKVTRQAKSRTIQIDPIGLASRTEEDIYQELFEQAVNDMEPA